MSEFKAQSWGLWVGLNLSKDFDRMLRDEFYTSFSESIQANESCEPCFQIVRTFNMMILSMKFSHSFTFLELFVIIIFMPLRTLLNILKLTDSLGCILWQLLSFAFRMIYKKYSIVNWSYNLELFNSVI